MKITPPHVVIVGAGFGGLYAARALKKAFARVTVIDRQNHHLFQPLLYQVATAGLNPSDIAAPIRSVLRRQKNTSVILGEVVSVELPDQRVILKDGVVLYDYLIIATGATHSYFGHDEWAQCAPGLKSIDDALQIRQRVLLAFEAAEREANPRMRQAWLSFVVIGGGPTGVELAGALAELSRHTLAKDFRNIDSTQARVILLEGLPRILSSYPEDLSQKAKEQLEKLGVEVRLSTHATHIDATGVFVGTDHIPSQTVLWGAGVQASPLAKSLGVLLDKAGRVLVNKDLTVPGHKEVFVIGDLAAVFQKDGKMVPGVAPAAIQEGKHVARNIQHAIKNEPYEAFRYRDKGSLATIGRAAGVADLGPIHFSGLPAWLAWLVVHIFFLIGFRNRYFVLLQWAWSYVTYQRGARLITGPVDPLFDKMIDVQT